MEEPRHWIKFYIEYLEEPKWATLPDRLWRRAAEFNLMAAINRADGRLPTPAQMAWKLRKDTSEIELDLNQLASPGTDIVRRLPDGGWEVVDFLERQGPSEKSKRIMAWRDKKDKQQLHNSESESESDSESDSESESESESARNNNVTVTQQLQPDQKEILRRERSAFLDAVSAKKFSDDDEFSWFVNLAMDYPDWKVRQWIEWVKKRHLTKAQALKSMGDTLLNWKGQPSREDLERDEHREKTSRLEIVNGPGTGKEPDHAGI